jgi:hypothetical protein
MKRMRWCAFLFLAFGSILIVTFGCSTDSECEGGQMRCVGQVVQNCEDHRWVSIKDCEATLDICGSCYWPNLTGEICCLPWP